MELHTQKKGECKTTTTANTTNKGNPTVSSQPPTLAEHTTTRAGTAAKNASDSDNDWKHEKIL